MLLWSLRIDLTLLMVLLALQAALAAGFVSGSVGLLSIHGVNAFFITVLAFIGFALAGLFYFVSRGPLWPFPSTGLLWLATFVQEIFGYVRLVGVHIFFGVTVISVAAVVCALVWRTPYNRRPGRSELREASR
ncbi:hypothetical protein LWF01_07965 [Saxibacter everestensis]|uniref:Integral membrane protein n=1 Tax=Saxibacter everestensis TaxID=2909229 RepID=A0ABY8QZ19_9MICO|nr:hypothetical protein LWF01_07965 [Brevibacteriaceae bacterium ZFBP1038]